MQWFIACAPTRAASCNDASRMRGSSQLLLRCSLRAAAEAAHSTRAAAELVDPVDPAVLVDPAELVALVVLVALEAPAALEVRAASAA
jgi:hypothetical protein